MLGYFLYITHGEVNNSITNRFMDKMNKTGSTRQLVNGVLLLVSFFFVRIVWGGKMVC
jgi:hypothetical protein